MTSESLRTVTVVLQTNLRPTGANAARLTTRSAAFSIVTAGQFPEPAPVTAA